MAVETFPVLIIIIFVGIIFVIGIISLLVFIFASRKKNNKNNAKPINYNIPAANISRPTVKTLKRCPACQSTYTDESLNYCLSDGTILERTDEVETVVFRPK